MQVQLKAAYVDVWESCHPKLKTKLKALPNYKQIDTGKDVIQLGLQIRALAAEPRALNIRFIPWCSSTE